MAKAIGLGHLGSDKRYATNAARVSNRDELMPMLQAALSTQSAEHWIRTFEAVKVPCGPVCNMQQVFDHPQVVAREMRIDLPHPTAAEGTVPGVRCLPGDLVRHLSPWSAHALTPPRTCTSRARKREDLVRCGCGQKL